VADRIRRLATPILLLLVLGFLVTGLTPIRSQDQDPVARAQPGDTVFVWFNFVKPDMVEQYEEFVFEILMPAIEEIAEEDSGRRAQAVQTRLLRPVRPDSDGTLPYVWLMDPAVTGKSYSFASVLREVYPEEEVGGFLEMFSETEAKPQVMYRTTQSDW
jgi:hypothetical protein